MRPSELPRFLITAALDGSCIGRFDPSPFIGESWIGCLYLADERFIWGRFIQVDLRQHTCEFLPDNPTTMVLLRVGTPYPYLDGYWGERAELVLKTDQTWREANFQPSDAVQVSVPQGIMWTRSTEKAPIGDRIPNGWDHEHCSICWERIGCEGQATGFVNEADDWVCGECFGLFVSPKSLAFVIWQPGYLHPTGP